MSKRSVPVDQAERIKEIRSRYPLLPISIALACAKSKSLYEMVLADSTITTRELTRLWGGRKVPHLGKRPARSRIRP